MDIIKSKKPYIKERKHSYLI